MVSQAGRWLLLAALLLSGPVQAWGGFAHRLVAELAQTRLSPAAQAQLQVLLAQEPGADLRSIASWADTVRERPAYRHTGRLHYVNFPRHHCRYEAARDCPGGACVVAGLQHYTAVLADRARPAPERLQALKFVVHLAADVHQPLHAGFFDDRGGNRFQLELDGHGSNLHAVWDHHILASAGLRARTYRARLNMALATVAPGPLDPVRWAEESCALIASASIYPARPGRLPADYLERQRPLAEQRLVLAAVRLAALLEHSLAAPGEANKRK